VHVQKTADFSSIVNDMTLTAKQLKSSLSFADVMEELTTKAEDLKEVQEQRVNSTMVSKSGQLVVKLLEILEVVVVKVVGEMENQVMY
jgi:hypothetical protein